MTRINFEVSEPYARHIDQLIEISGLKTKAALYDAAIALFDWAVRERRAGKEICARDINTREITKLEMRGFPPLPQPEKVREPVKTQVLEPAD